MGQRRTGLVGRQAESDELSAAVRDRTLVVLCGQEGTGRTVLLTQAGRELGDRGIVVLEVSGTTPRPGWDRFGVTAVLGAIRERFEDLGAGARLTDAMDALSQLCTETAYASVGGRSRLVNALGAVLRGVGEVALFVDDADLLSQPVVTLAAARQTGLRVVASCVADPELRELADVVIQLDALSAKDSDRVLRQAAGLPIDDAFRLALRKQLGSWYRNPGTLVSTVAELRRLDRLVAVHGHLCLRDLREPIALPAGHRLLGLVDPLGRDLVRLAAHAGFGMDEILTLGASREYGRAADRLVQAGVLGADAAGRLTVRCPALGAALSGDSPRQAIVDRRGLRPADFVRLLVRTADYRRLAEFVEQVPDGELDPAELAAAAVLAALCTGGPVAESVRKAVTGRGQVPAAIGFHDRWCAGDEISVGDVEAAFSTLRRSPVVTTIERRVRGAEQALALRDPVPVLASVLGKDFGTPAVGPLAAYHRVLTGYADGAWTAALSAAREVELEPRADLRARQSARLHAAEMCAWRGEDRRAAAWLDSVPDDECAFPALRRWVELGQQCLAGDAAGTRRTGRLGGPGTSRLLRRMAAVAMESGDLPRADRVLAEAERAYSRRTTPEARETVLYVRGVVNGEGAMAAERLIRGRGDRFELALACQLVATTAAEPRPWLTEAFEIAQSIGATRLIARTKRSFAGTGPVVSRPRGRREHLSETELRIIELIRLGRTNRQIALAVRMSEKTVAKHLTRLFARAGCRTRHGLATSGLGGRPESLGA